MIYGLFSFGFTLYFFSAVFAYSHNGTWLSYLTGAAVFGATTSMLWFAVSRIAVSDSQRMMLAIGWDAMIALTYFFVGCLLFSASPSLKQILGAVMVLAGCFFLQ